ncbi:MAG: hypothetical protein QOC82_2923, partial [Frankiaceae bacterium]|nr:hypothetical protein [Frankiaceae bacterium]
MGRRVLCGLLATGLVVFFAPAAARAATGTAVCGQLPAGVTTWTALGSPYQICGAGVTVPSGSTLRIDALAGEVDVTQVANGYGLTVVGAIETANTLTGRGAVLDTPIRVHGAAGTANYYAAGSVDLSDAELAGGVSGQVDSLVLSRVHSDGAMYWISAKSSSVTDSTFVLPTCGHSAGEFVLNDAVTQPSQDDTVSFVGNEVHGCAVWIQSADLTVSNNRVDDVPADPAINIAGDHYTLGVGGSVSGNTGANDAITAMNLFGEEQGSFTWRGIPDTSDAEQPLGDLSTNGLTAQGPAAVVTVPAGTAVYAGQLGMAGAILDASAGGARFECRPQSPPVACHTRLTVGMPAGTDQAGLRINNGYVDGTIDATGTATTAATVDINDSTVTGGISTSNTSMHIDGSTVGAVWATDAGDTTVANTTAPSIYAIAANSGNITFSGDTVGPTQWADPPLNANTWSGTAVITDNTVYGAGVAVHTGLVRPAV